ncbi:MAG: hypothetical protein Q4G05_03870 [Clostridia bacterium]|nr:hypothetical protein [Clostridia bacterium]
MYRGKHYKCGGKGAGRHAKNRIIVFSKSKGKHSKNEIVTYNPVYARIVTCLSSIAVTTSFVACVSLGKFKTTLGCDDTSKIARFAIDLSSLQTSIENFVPNSTRDFDFMITNFEEIDSEIFSSDVKLRYRIVIENKSKNLPLEFNLSKIDRENNDEILTQITLTNNISDWFELENINQKDDYRLTLIWNVGDGIDSSYSNISDLFEVLAEFEQID